MNGHAIYVEIHTADRQTDRTRFSYWIQDFMVDDFGEGETLKERVVDVVTNHQVGRDMLRGHFTDHSIELDEESDRAEKLAEYPDLSIRNVGVDRIYIFKATPLGRLPVKDDGP